MLPRFCKLCYRVVDESIVKLRRYSAKHTKATEKYFSDDENGIQEEEFVDTEDAKPLEKPEKKVCIIKCKRSNFDFYEGDTYSKFQPIPLASRGWQHRDSRGDYFTIFPTETVTEEEMIDTSSTFEDININEELVKNLKNNDIFHPTHIQKLGIPRILESQNVILTAETGCGKTFAFLIPLLHQILQWKPMQERGYNRPLGLVLTPSRELAIQISKEAKKLAKGLNINITTLTGGKTKKMFSNPPVGEVDLVIATLGVISKLATTNIFKMEHVKHVVLDEADTLFDETFNEKLGHFLRRIPIGAGRDPNQKYPKTAQLTLNSATIPENLPGTLENVVNPDSLLPVTTGYEHRVGVPQKFLRLGGPEKPMMLLKLVKPKEKSKIPVIIFSNTTSTCNFTGTFLKQFGIRCIHLHGDLPMEVRRGKFSEFQNGKYNILTTTDAGARGLDTIQAKDVINYDFPLITSEYIHRCGRTGRIGSPRDCRVINFISRPIEIILTKKIEFATRKMKPIPMVDMLHKSENEETDFLSSDSISETKSRMEPTGDTLDLDDTDTGFPFRIKNKPEM